MAAGESASMLTVRSGGECSVVIAIIGTMFCANMNWFMVEMTDNPILASLH